VNKAEIAASQHLEQMVLGKLNEVLAYDYRGPRTGFTEAHVLKAIVILGELGLVGRGKLATLLNLGQGEIRTLIKRLKDNELIDVGINGCVLTGKGQKEQAAVRRLIPWFGRVDARSLGIGQYCWAVVVRGRSKKIRIGIEQIDAAIKAGATGALTVIFSSGRFKVPGERTDCEKASPGEPWNMIRKAQPEEGDVIIISGATDWLNAEHGGWTAVLTVI
jgi:hypothetical protein